jgi:hypothetical protein
VAVSLTPTTTRETVAQGMPEKRQANGEPTAASTAKSAEVKPPGPCQTCAHRKYVDQSNDAGVSFKAPAHIPAAAAGAVVSAHEHEHVSRNQAAAQAEGREVVSQTVQIHTARCPECGRIYVAGGTTTTTTRSVPQSTPPQGTGRYLNALA